MNKFVIISGKPNSGKTHLAKGIITLFGKDESYYEGTPFFTKAKLRDLSNKYKLLVLEECNEAIIHDLYKQGLKYPFNCNIVITTQDHIDDDFNSDVTVIHL